MASPYLSNLPPLVVIDTILFLRALQGRPDPLLSSALSSLQPRREPLPQLLLRPHLLLLLEDLLLLQRSDREWDPHQQTRRHHRPENPSRKETNRFGGRDCARKCGVETAAGGRGEDIFEGVEAVREGFGGEVGLGVCVGEGGV